MSLAHNSVARYNEWVKTVQYGKKKKSQKNAVDFFMREHLHWHTASNDMVEYIEKYTGKMFGKSGRRSLCRCLNDLIDMKIVETRKTSEGYRFYRHTLRVVPIIEEYESDTDDEKYESDDVKEENLDEKKEDRIEMKDIVLSQEVPRIERIEQPLPDIPIKIYEINKRWKKKVSPSQEMEDDETREIEMALFTISIEQENDLFDDDSTSEFGTRPLEWLGLIIFTSFMSYFLGKCDW